MLNLSKLVYILLLPLYCNINCMNLDILVNFEKCQYSCGDHWSKWPPVWRPRGLVMLFQRWEPRRKQPSPSSGSFQGSPINMIPAGLTSHACDPSTATGKSPRKVGTLDAVTSFRRHLGKPDTFCSLSPPTHCAAVDLWRSVPYQPSPSGRSLYCFVSFCLRLRAMIRRPSDSNFLAPSCA